MKKNDTLRVLIAGGGTGGHVIPALAVADGLRQADPKCDILFVGDSKGLETRLVPDRGYTLHTLTVGKFKGTRWIGRAKTLAAVPTAVLRGLGILRNFRPQVVVGVGGYASVPMVIAASLLRIPVVLLEQNAVAGLTNRTLARFATRIVIALPGAAKSFPAKRTIQLGNPLSPTFLEAFENPLDPGEKAPCLLVLGGSQGASAVNKLVVEAAPRIIRQFPTLRLIHQSGERDAQWVERRYAELGIDARVETFIEDTAAAYRQATVMVGRAGATTIAELTVAGLPAMLIPFPAAADDHQTANAADLVNAGAAFMVQQAALSAKQLASILTDMFSNRDRLTRMAAAMRANAHPSAAHDVAELVRALAAL